MINRLTTPAPVSLPATSSSLNPAGTSSDPSPTTPGEAPARQVAANARVHPAADRTRHPGRSAPDSPHPAATAEAHSSQLSEQEQEDLRKLQERDREVRAHEQAHHALAKGHASSPHYTYKRAPDGRLYAVDGEVSIDTTPIHNNPRATIDKMQSVRHAALAPTSPSSQDRKVAAEALQTEQQARAELHQDSPQDDPQDPPAAEVPPSTASDSLAEPPASRPPHPSPSAADRIRNQRGHHQYSHQPPPQTVTHLSGPNPHP